MKKFIVQSMLAVLTAFPLAGFSQTNLTQDPGYLAIDKAIDLETIHPTVNVNIPRFLLKGVLSGLDDAGANPAQPGENDIADLLKDIKLIRVMVIEADEDNRAALDKAAKSLRSELDKKWTAIVSVHDGNDNVGVYVMPDASGDSTTGLALLVHDDDDLVIGNIVGNVSIEKLMKVARQSNKIPKDLLKKLGVPTAMLGAQPEPDGAPAEVVTIPKITGACDLSAKEVLKRALEARGGAGALRNIRSLHAKGRININDCPTCGSLVGADATTTEYFTMRPDKWRAVVAFKSSGGQDLGGVDEGFDGRHGWDNEPGVEPRRLTGRPLDQAKQSGQFFAWQEDPAGYESTESLGQASFDGKACYALKVVQKSGDEEIHYFDTNNFLLAGCIYTAHTYYGSSLDKDSYGDYREFGGFKLPMRIGWQSKWSRGVVQYDSLELNGVKEPDLEMPEQQTATADNSGK